MSSPGSAPAVGTLLIEGEHQDIRIDVRQLLGETQADRWLATPNLNFEGRRPLDLVGTPDERLVRDSLRSVIYSGMA